MRVYYDSTPFEDDIEEMQAVLTEVIANTPFATAPNVEVIVDLESRKNLEVYKYVVYARKE